MKNTIRFFAVALIVLGFAFNAAAQVTANAYSDAWIVQPLTILKVNDMHFGNIGVIGIPGTIILSTASGRTGTGGATPATPTGTVSAATFDVTGAAGQQVYITINSGAVGAATINVVHTNTVDQMVVNTFVTNPVSGTALPAGGAVTIQVGATLNTLANQLPGYYKSADWALTVNYQ